MTFEKIYAKVSTGKMSAKEAYQKLGEKDLNKKITFYANKKNISADPLTDAQLQELTALVEILQFLYNSSEDSPVSDSMYDSLQELLIDMGIPRLTGTIELNPSDKVHHTYTTLRGTLDKVYYLTKEEPRSNKSRKYLDEWIKSTESDYQKKSGTSIHLNDVKVILQPKFDGTSSIMEYNGEKSLWITRGDTERNLASDVSHVMRQFNDVFQQYGIGGQKFEVMITEDDKDKINVFYKDHPYHNSRQIVTSILNSNEVDFKSEYLYPVPLRIMSPEDEIERIHPYLLEKFPTKICTFGDREEIRSFANHNRYVEVDGKRFRTDGVVITILDSKIQKILGRDRNINNFEVAYKFTEEAAYTKVKDIEFYLSDFSYITPVLVVNDVILKGNRINHISLSNKERFDELNLSYGDEIKVLYDIIPYATLDEKCKRVPNGRKISFVEECPKCHEKLDLSKVQVRCVNPRCPSRLVGRIVNYCRTLKMMNIGYHTIDMLFSVGLLNHGIASLYKLKKHKHEIEDLEGFGKLKTGKILKEIEKRKTLRDYEFFGAIGIAGISTTTFQTIFQEVPYKEFIELYRSNKFQDIYKKLIQVSTIQDTRANLILEQLQDKNFRSELLTVLKEISILQTYTEKKKSFQGTIVVSGFRPDKILMEKIVKAGYKYSENWTNRAKYLVVPYTDYHSSKVDKAYNKGISIITTTQLEEILK